MDTLVDTIEKLRAEGYTEDLNLLSNCIGCRDNNYRIFHNEFIIDKTYRFEGETDPADEVNLYAISAPKYNIKGILVNGEGIYSDELTDEMVQALKIKRQ